MITAPQSQIDESDESIEVEVHCDCAIQASKLEHWILSRDKCVYRERQKTTMFVNAKVHVDAGFTFGE